VTRLRSRLRHILIIVLAVVVLALPLMFLLENFVRDAIVTPAAYVVWLAGVIIGALPDTYLLGIAIILIVYIAVRSLLRERDEPDHQRIPHTPTEGSATTWLRKLQLVTKGTYSPQRLEHHIGQLVLRVVAYENRCSMREAGHLIESGQLDMPNELTPYIQAALSRRLPRTPTIWERLKALIIGHHRPKATDQNITEELEPMLSYVEKELKISLPEEERQ
jgi:hypothetical protein